MYVFNRRVRGVILILLIRWVLVLLRTHPYDTLRHLRRPMTVSSLCLRKPLRPNPARPMETLIGKIEQLLILFCFFPGITPG